MSEKGRENRLRRMAERQGLRLERSRRHDPRASSYGLYALKTWKTRQLVSEPGVRDDHALTLDEVEQYRGPQTATRSSSNIASRTFSPDWTTNSWSSACASTMLAYNPENMTEDEREHLLTTVGQAHAGLSEVALKLRLGLPPKTPALKTAIKAERVAFDLKRSLQRLEVKDVETITRRAPVLPEVRRGGKVVDPESLLRHENRHDKRLTGLPRRNTPRRSG